MIIPTTSTTRTVVVEPGRGLDEQTEQALVVLRDRQEDRLVRTQQQTMTLRQKIEAANARRRQAAEGAPPDEGTGRDQADPRNDKASELCSLADALDWPEIDVPSADSAGGGPTVGEFSHMLTELRGEGGLSAQILSDGVHLFGHTEWNGDTLLTISCGATSHYGLAPELIPSSITGRYRSSPPSDFFGRVFGLTGTYHPIFAADDKWCKCFRVLRQTAWQLVGGTWRMLGERIERHTLIDLENETGFGQQGFDLPGFTPMPVIEVGLADRNATVWVQLEARFDVQLEGEAIIRFSPQPNPSQSVVFRTYGWWLRPA